MAPDSEPQWPPRSPHEALLSTPGGRQRYREMANRTSPSPSPMRSSRALAAITSSPSAGLGIHLPEDGDDDEDEETLQLKLQEIQARLKLKKLQNAKAREQATAQRGNETEPRSDPVMPSPSRRAARARTPGADENARPASQNQIAVPASPVRKLQFLQQQTSPSRVYLGIDKGLKAKDISLKRAPNQKGSKFGASSQNGGYLNQSKSLHSVESSRPLSFNERLASARTEEAEKALKKEKIQRLRTNAFSIGQDEMEHYKTKAIDIPDEPLQPRTFTREEILSTATPSSSGLPRSNTAPNLHSRLDTQSPSLSSSTLEKTATEDASSTDGKCGEASFEAYSCMHLSKRILPHTVLTRHVSGKRVINVKDLLREVKAPDFALPDVEQDVVVFAVVARKSEPRAHKPTANQKQEDRGKYSVMTLTDLEFELDLFLFNSGFTRFWKLTEGTVVAILNPSIMPPPPGRQDTGRFSLVINSDEDTILEIGSARDLGFCQSVKKDGEACGAWVNKKKTHFCEFHSNEAVRKQRSSRQEVNSNGFGGWERRGKSGPSGNKDEKKKGSSNYDWETRTQWFAARSHSAADLIDGKDRTAADKKERAEFIKRGLEAREREREMMKKLGKVGNAAGREYMERAGIKASSNQSTAVSGQADGKSEVPQAGSTANELMSLGLNSKDRTIHLSPVKRKRRPDSSQASSTVGSTKSSSSSLAAYGWGSNLKDKLSKMKEGEKLHKGDPPPVRKKTRFVTEKGIREAGRESLGIDFSERQISLGEDDDDEELVII
ncbi:hypothetical protein QQS21_004289 [Conoideocrella luteorostrata]|uniref:Zinc finger Mcm10/DnaG-type domain-containing protein n=1 Tax=Conoideocrella luteorostrata TaxID=1105319 RepID=A0AAJ0FVL5_9HYPO|nr:hypothetical protein QQS21_004289 [Conoideocrella luteorostrata]